MGLSLFTVLAAALRVIFAPSIYEIPFGPIVQALVAILAAVAIFLRLRDSIDTG